MSSREEMSVDVVLPLALPGVLTYLLPETLADKVTVGSRVVVPLGPRKFYTAIVVRRPGTPLSAEVRMKEVADVVDPAPLILPHQLELWRWMAGYYLCTSGEVMKAALPSGLKLESETMVSAVREYVSDEPFSLREGKVYDALCREQAVSIEQLMKKMGSTPGVLPALRRLIDREAVVVQEDLRRTFKAKTEICVRLTAGYRDEKRQQELLNALERRSPRQFSVVTALLETPEMRRSELLKAVPAGAESALPALKKKGIVETFSVETGRIKTLSADREAASRPLNAAQATAFRGILDQFSAKEVCLLHGVTSSGKTEIYIKLIEQELKAGRQVLYLLPEIALTTQITTRLGRVFGEKMGVYHSKFPDAERVELWQRQLTERAFGLILGVRSSLFLPFRRLGLVIVDEEHETSYKQQDPAPRYNARDAAIVLARQYGAKVLLGTATPALETYHNAVVSGKYGIVTLTERYGGVLLPQIVVEDVKELRRKKLMRSSLSPRLVEEIKAALEGGEQAILFQNRRGYAPVTECRTCGWTPHCAACDVSLTFHQQINKLVCHYCGAAYDMPRCCPNCEETDLRPVGYGTEKIEEEVKTSFPGAKVARMDLDTTRSRSAYERIISDFQARKTDILIGTQMVTKGLDFDSVRVVGILSADQMLSQPNFRAYERAYQMMAQVAGRAGRRGKRGIVVLQTRQPDLPIIRQVTDNAYQDMFRMQLIEREMFRWPPCFRVIDICLKHRKEAVCGSAADALAAMLHRHFGDNLLGPDRPAVGRVQFMHIRKLVLKVSSGYSPAGVRRTLSAAREALLALPDFRSVSVYFDVDPL